MSTEVRKLYVNLFVTSS